MIRVSMDLVSLLSVLGVSASVSSLFTYWVFRREIEREVER